MKKINPDAAWGIALLIALLIITFVYIIPESIKAREKETEEYEFSFSVDSSYIVTSEHDTIHIEKLYLKNVTVDEKN